MQAVGAKATQFLGAAKVAYDSDAAQAAKENCKRCGKGLSRHWTQEIPKEETAGHSWYVEEGRGEESFHRFVKTGDLYPSISPDWAAWKGLQIVLWTLPVTAGSLLLHGGQAGFQLLRRGADQLVTVQDIYHKYQQEKRKPDFNRTTFMQAYSKALRPSKESFSPLVVMLKDVLYGGKAVIGGLYYSLYNPLGGRPFFNQIHKDWRSGVAPIKEEQIRALSVASTIYHVLKGSLSLPQIFHIHPIGKEKHEGKREETAPAPAAASVRRRSEDQVEGVAQPLGAGEQTTEDDGW